MMSFAGRRILVTGGAGYIGSHTLLHLLQLRAELLVVDNFSNSSPIALERVAQLAGHSFAHVALDLRNGLGLRTALETFRPEAVIHFAGSKAVSESVERPLLYYDNNISGTLRLLEAMDAVGCRRMLFSSSATVYGEPHYLPLDETHPVCPVNPYGRTKAMIEEILQDWATVSPNRSGVSLRYFNPVGAHASSQIGEAPCGIPNNLMPYVAQVACGALPKVSVLGDDFETRDGSGERDYIHVEDLATGHVAALGHLWKQPGYDVFNLGTGSGSTVFEVIEAFGKAVGRPIPYSIIGRRTGDTAASIADASKAERVLGWKATHSLQEACDSSWNWQRQNPNGYDA